MLCPPPPWMEGEHIHLSHLLYHWQKVNRLGKVFFPLGGIAFHMPEYNNYPQPSTPVCSYDPPPSRHISLSPASFIVYRNERQAAWQAYHFCLYIFSMMCLMPAPCSPPPLLLLSTLLAYAWAYAAIVIPLYRLILSRVRARLACQNDISHTQPARLCLPLSLSPALSLRVCACVCVCRQLHLASHTLVLPLHIHRIALFARQRRLPHGSCHCHSHRCCPQFCRHIFGLPYEFSVSYDWRAI